MPGDVIPTPAVEVHEKAPHIIELESSVRQSFFEQKRIRQEIRKRQKMLKDLLEADGVYSDLNEQVKQTRSELRAAKAKVLEKPDAFKLSSEINTLKHDQKVEQLSFSDILFEYSQTSNQMTLVIDEEDGEVLDIVKQAKVISRKKQR